MNRCAWSAAALFWMLAATAAGANDLEESCKRAMNARIQVCTDDCTKAALAAASDYVDTNHNVKFGCLKGCALRQALQGRVCTASGDAPAPETNH